MDYSTYCTPERGTGRSYEGWHLKTLRAYDDEAQAKAVARTYGGSVFYCEYGNCYHISGGYRRKASSLLGIGGRA